MTVRKGEAALRSAAAWVGHSYPVGMCLRWTRERFNIPKKYPSASVAWRYAKHRHTSAPPPRGYPVFYLGGASGFGHVCESAGNGYIYTTDLPTGGKVGKVHYTEPSKKWGLSYAGWTSDLNAVSVWCRTVHLGKLRYAAKSRPWAYKYGTFAVQRALWKRGLLAFKYVNGYYGKNTKSAYAAWQKRLGYNGAAADGIPGTRSLRHLGWYAPYLIAVA